MFSGVKWIPGTQNFRIKNLLDEWAIPSPQDQMSSSSKAPAFFPVWSRDDSICHWGRPQSGLCVRNVTKANAGGGDSGPGHHGPPPCSYAMIRVWGLPLPSTPEAHSALGVWWCCSLQSLFSFVLMLHSPLYRGLEELAFIKAQIRNGFVFQHLSCEHCQGH